MGLCTGEGQGSKELVRRFYVVAVLLAGSEKTCLFGEDTGDRLGIKKMRESLHARAGLHETETTRRPSTEDTRMAFRVQKVCNMLTASTPPIGKERSKF